MNIFNKIKNQTEVSNDEAKIGCIYSFAYIYSKLLIKTGELLNSDSDSDFENVLIIRFEI